MHLTINTRANHVAARIVRAAGTRKHTAFAGVHTPGTTWLSGWDGGSRDEWYVVYKLSETNWRIERAETELDPDRTNDPWKHRRIVPALPDNAVAYVRAGVSSGKPATMTVLFRTDADLHRYTAG